MTDSVTKKGCPKIHIDTSFLCEPVRSQEGERRNKMQKKEIDDLNDTIKWFKTARRNNDMACILPDGPMMKNIIKWLEKLREYENRQEKGEKHDKSVLMIDAPEHGCVSCLIGRNHSNCLEICIYCPIAGKSALDEEAEILVRTFAKYPDRTALTDTFVESLKLLTDAIESQMEEVK